MTGSNIEGYIDEIESLINRIKGDIYQDNSNIKNYQEISNLIKNLLKYKELLNKNALKNSNKIISLNNKISMYKRMIHEERDDSFKLENFLIKRLETILVELNNIRSFRHGDTIEKNIEAITSLDKKEDDEGNN